MSVRSRIAEEKIIILLSGALTILVALILILILGTIALSGIPSINLKYLTSAEGDVRGFGSAIGNAIIGTVYLSGLSVLLATPFALCTAVYLKKYAKDNYITRAIRLIIDIFSGTPSIIVGVLGLILICYYLMPLTGGWSLMSGAISLAVLILPPIEKAIEDALGTVPVEIEDASYALGATKWRTVRGITIPYAKSGIVTGVVLGVGRAAEESAVVILTTGYFQFFPSYGLVHSQKTLFGIQILPLQGPIGTLPIAIYNAYQYPSLAPISGAWGAALILILVVLSINMTARLILWRWKMG